MHKNTKLLPYQRREAFRRWRDGDRATDLAHYYRVSRKTLYAVFHKARLDVFENYSSKNLRFRTLEYGLKNLEKTDKKIGKILADTCQESTATESVCEEISGRNGTH